MKFTNEYPHDSHFPYLVISASHGLVAKFKNPSEANALKTIGGASYDVATTMRLAIPKDFIYITWSHGSIPHYARRTEEMWIFGSDKITEEVLLREHVGDAAIIGLQPTTSRLSGVDGPDYGQGLIQGR